jgi:hypothetical protein
MTGRGDYWFSFEQEHALNGLDLTSFAMPANLLRLSVVVKLYSTIK